MIVPLAVVTTRCGTSRPHRSASAVPAGPSSMYRVGAGTNAGGSEGACSRPPLAITTATYGSTQPSTSATAATAVSTFHSTTASSTQTVRTPIEMTYRRWRARTSSVSPSRAPVIRKTSGSPARFRITFHHPLDPPESRCPVGFHGTPPLRPLRDPGRSARQRPGCAGRRTPASGIRPGRAGGSPVQRSQVRGRHPVGQPHPVGAHPEAVAGRGQPGRVHRQHHRPAVPRPDPRSRSPRRPTGARPAGTSAAARPAAPAARWPPPCRGRARRAARRPPAPGPPGPSGPGWPGSGCRPPENAKRCLSLPATTCVQLGAVDPPAGRRTAGEQLVHVHPAALVEGDPRRRRLVPEHQRQELRHLHRPLLVHRLPPVARHVPPVTRPG